MAASKAGGRDRRRIERMRSAAGDVAYKVLVAALGAATIYLGATFSVNLYRGISWHAAQSAKLEKEKVGE